MALQGGIKPGENVEEKEDMPTKILYFKQKEMK
jgi:hypothetical protein